MLDSILAGAIENPAAYITAITALIGILTVIYKKLKPLVKLMRNYDGVAQKIDCILEELSPNGGTTIKDSIGRIEKLVTLSSERQRAILADSQNPIFETDKNGNCIWVNRTYMRLVKRSFSELTHTGWINAIAREDRDKILTKWEDAINHDREFNEEVELIDSDNNHIPATIVTYIMRDSDKNVLGYLGVISQN